MSPVQRLPPSLTPAEIALGALLDRLAPVAPIELPLAEALGSVAAEMPSLAACPPHDIAAADGWALCANDLVGASSYSPLPLATPPAWVDAGDVMPAGCDCVLDADAVESAGAVVQVLAEATPGQGVRRAGGDISQGTAAAMVGLPLRAADLLLARAAGLNALGVRRPRLRIVNVAEASLTMRFILESARASGADVHAVEVRARDVASIAEALDAASPDLVLMVGGTGVGRLDASIAALTRRGDVLAHGIALRPGRTAATARLAQIPVIAFPGSPDQAIGVWLALALPVLDRLSARRPRPRRNFPLARKIASNVGLTEIALLADENGQWLPLAVGELPLQAIARADAWLQIAGDSEGFAAGTPVAAYLMRE